MQVDHLQDGKTGLHFAVEEGFIEVIKVLLKFNANTNVAVSGDVKYNYTDGILLIILCSV